MAWTGEKFRIFTEVKKLRLSDLADVNWATFIRELKISRDST